MMDDVKCYKTDAKVYDQYTIITPDYHITATGDNSCYTAGGSLCSVNARNHVEREIVEKEGSHHDLPRSVKDRIYSDDSYMDSYGKEMKFQDLPKKIQKSFLSAFPEFKELVENK